MQLQACKCDKCGHECLSVKDSQHRRCGGSEGTKPRNKSDKLPTISRGKWK